MPAGMMKKIGRQFRGQACLSFQVGDEAYCEPALGQGAGLVGAGDIDAAQRLDAGKAADQGVPLGQAAGYGALADAGQDRQAFGDGGNARWSRPV